MLILSAADLLSYGRSLARIRRSHLPLFPTSKKLFRPHEASPLATLELMFHMLLKAMRGCHKEGQEGGWFPASQGTSR
jgi:hypothetical protein